MTASMIPLTQVSLIVIVITNWKLGFEVWLIRFLLTEAFCYWPKESRLDDKKLDDFQSDLIGKRDTIFAFRTYVLTMWIPFPLWSSNFVVCVASLLTSGAFPRSRRRKSETFRTQYIDTKELRFFWFSFSSHMASVIIRLFI